MAQRCVRTSEGEASSRCVGPGPKWAVESRDYTLNIRLGLLIVIVVLYPY